MSDRNPETGQFVKGKAGGPGRPKGSRNKLGEAFLTDLYADWKVNGLATIEAVREERPHEYLKVVASILPKELNVNTNAFADVDDDELATILDAARSALVAQSDRGAGDGDEASTRH